VVHIARRKIDVSVVIGVVVVFAIIGAAVFGAYYFLVYSPAQQRLEDAKTDALGYLDETLGSISTSQADSAAASYRVQIQDAGSPGEVATIRSEVTSAYNRESKRSNLLAEVDQATSGSFYSLPDLESSLKSDINSKTTLSALESYEQSGAIDNQASTAWRSLHTGIISSISDNEVVMRQRDSPTYVEYMTKDEALSHIQANSWSTLRELRFENTGSYEVPIIDTFQHAPTIKAGSIVDVYIYNYSTENMVRRVGGATVRSVIYPREELGVISWTLSDDDVSHAYSTNVWEAIKAATAGNTDAASISWANYAEDLMESAVNAGIGDFDLQALYVIEVPAREDAEDLTHVEQYLSSTKDVVLLAQITS